MGGLLRPGNLLWETIAGMLNRAHPQVSFASPMLPPELGGAILLGRQALDTSIPYEELIANLSSSTKDNSPPTA